jgi:ATP adenylyltransferase
VALEHLWAGWRTEYVTGLTEAERRGEEVGCVFCHLARGDDAEAEQQVVWRGPLTFCVLNAYPYASGHVLVLPLRHVGELDELTAEESDELWRTTRAAIDALIAAYAPDGVNMGANLGRTAGAGIPGHLHLHALPRWTGDTNFMTTVAGVRVMPESLATSGEKLRAAWPQ